jgi:F0F1-type ATP synthase assembly protein I
MTAHQLRLSMAKTPANIWAQVGFYTSLGFILPAGGLVGSAVGWLLDRWLHTSPVLTVILGFMGAAAGLTEVLRILGRAEKDADRDHSNSGPGSS